MILEAKDGCSPVLPLLEGVVVEKEELQRSGFIIGRRIDILEGEDGERMF